MKTKGLFLIRCLLIKRFPSENAPTRKPRTGLLTDYFSSEYDLENSFVIGDRLTDVELAKNLRRKSFILSMTIRT